MATIGKSADDVPAGAPVLRLIAFDRRWCFAARSLVQHNVLARIMRLPGARSVPQETGRAISTLRDDAEAISMMGDWTFDATSALVFGASSMAILLTINARVTVLVMPPLIL